VTERKKSSRADKAVERRQAVIAAATEVFVAKGFAAARIEDVAARAGVAKGTVYLSFADKEALFEAAVKAQMLPVAERVRATLEPGPGSARQAIEAFLFTALDELSEPRTGDVVRLVVGESIRFPELTRFYRREVIGPIQQRCAALLIQAAANGELTTPETARYPLLVIAPMMMVVIGRGVMQEMGLVDPRPLLRAHLDALFGPSRDGAA